MAFVTPSTVFNNSLSFNTSTAFLNPSHRLSQPHRVTFRRPFPSISAVCSTTADSTTTLGGGATSSSSFQNSSFYEVLGIQAGASGKEIKAAYRKLARVLHPDVVVASNGHKEATSADGFIRVHEAYTTLSDPKKRADYDRMMWVKGRRLSYSPTYCSMGTTKYATSSCSGFSGYTRRTWETDQCW